MDSDILLLFIIIIFVFFILILVYLYRSPTGKKSDAVDLHDFNWDSVKNYDIDDIHITVYKYKTTVIKKYNHDSDIDNLNIKSISVTKNTENGYRVYVFDYPTMMYIKNRYRGEKPDNHHIEEFLSVIKDI